MWGTGIEKKKVAPLAAGIEPIGQMVFFYVVIKIRYFKPQRLSIMLINNHCTLHVVESPTV